MKTINDFNFENKKALIRVDFNVPLDESFNVTDATRIQAAKPTIIKVLEDGGSAVLMSHLGRPKGVQDQFSLRHIENAIEDIIGVESEKLPPKVVWSLRGRVKSRHVDFLITTPQGRPLMMIELDGSSHRSQAAIRPDSLKNSLAEAVGLPLKRVQVGQDFHKFVLNVESDLCRF